MGIQISIDSEPYGPNNEEKKMKLVTDDQGGGGGTFQADITSEFPTAEFTLVVSSVDPRPDSVKGGLITWKDRTISDAGTVFNYRLQCNSATSEGSVKATACLAGSTTNCADDSTAVKC